MTRSRDGISLDLKNGNNFARYSFSPNFDIYPADIPNADPLSL